LIKRACCVTRRCVQAHAFSLALARVFALGTQFEAEALLRHCTEWEAHCAEHGFASFAASVKVYLGSALSTLGRAQEGVAQMVEGLAAHRTAGGGLVVLPLLLELATGCGRAGRPTDGLEHLGEAERQIEVSGGRWVEAHLLRVRGDLLMIIGDRAAAEASFHQSISVASRQSARLDELLAATSLARLWRDQGKRTEARDLLAPVYNWFTEGFDTPVLQDAKALLDELA
jgi:predicted ATPase